MKLVILLAVVAAASAAPQFQGQQYRQPQREFQQYRQPQREVQQYRQPQREVQQFRQPQREVQQYRQPQREVQQYRQPQNEVQQYRQPQRNAQGPVTLKNYGFIQNYPEYIYGYAQDDGQVKQEEGNFKNAGTDEESLYVKGAYSWISPEGIPFTVTYTADEDGYQPTVEQGPGTSPAVLASILGG